MKYNNFVAEDPQQGEKEKMKKFLTAVAAMMVLAGCSSAAQPTPTPEAEVDYAAKSEGVMTYAEYAAAELDTEVVVETYVQAKQSWWEDKATIYTQDPDGGYFIYEMPISEEDYNKLTEGTKIKVTGYKSEWAGEVEITDAVYEIEEGNWIAEPVNADAVWGSPDMINFQNQKVVFTGVTVQDYTTDEGATGAAFAYKNPTDKTDDLYIQLMKGDTMYEFCVEYYLCNNETEVYKAVEALNVGDVVDVEGFLYWYNGPNLHITKVTAAK